MELFSGYKRLLANKTFCEIIIGLAYLTSYSIVLIATQNLDELAQETVKHTVTRNGYNQNAIRFYTLYPKSMKIHKHFAFWENFVTRWNVRIYWLTLTMVNISL